MKWLGSVAYWQEGKDEKRYRWSRPNPYDRV